MKTPDIILCICCLVFPALLMLLQKALEKRWARDQRAAMAYAAQEYRKYIANFRGEECGQVFDKKSSDFRSIL